MIEKDIAATCRLNVSATNNTIKQPDLLPQMAIDGGVVGESSMRYVPGLKYDGAPGTESLPNSGIPGKDFFSSDIYFNFSKSI